MTILRRVAQFALTVGLALSGVALIAEAVDAIGYEWRNHLGNLVADLASPTWKPWISALVGAALTVVGIGLGVVQFAPPKKGLRKLHQVSSGADGQTRIAGRAAIAAARHEVSGIDNVIGVDARISGNSMIIEAQVDDQADLDKVEIMVLERLDHGFWINLGLADFSLNLLVTYHSRPPRVR
ncbi:MAG: hypothetical protein OEW91_09040 [Acidimicrobiia bacterium]|nr:hypothetical protein [Acidimicrobiia bacterium]